MSGIERWYTWTSVRTKRPFLFHSTCALSVVLASLPANMPYRNSNPNLARKGAKRPYEEARVVLEGWHWSFTHCQFFVRLRRGQIEAQPLSNQCEKRKEGLTCQNLGRAGCSLTDHQTWVKLKTGLHREVDRFIQEARWHGIRHGGTGCVFFVILVTLQTLHVRLCLLRWCSGSPFEWTSCQCAARAAARSAGARAKRCAWGYMEGEGLEGLLPLKRHVTWMK